MVSDWSLLWCIDPTFPFLFHPSVFLPSPNISIWFKFRIRKYQRYNIKDGCLRIGWRMDIIYWNLEFGKRVSMKRTTVYGARRSDERLSDRWVTRWMILEEDKAEDGEAWCNRCGGPFRGDAWLTEEDEPNRIFDVSEKPETNGEQIRDRWGKDIVRDYLMVGENDRFFFG